VIKKCKYLLPLFVLLLISACSNESPTQFTAFDPSWSPDGSKITFSSDIDGNDEIYVMNADGSNQTRITNNDAEDWYPSWSPDGSKIAFTSERDGDFEIYVMNADSPQY